MVRDIYVSLRDKNLNLFDSLSGGGVFDNDTLYVHCRLRGGSNN